MTYKPPLKVPEETDFKSGDRVKINDPDNRKHGAEGVISTMGIAGCVVRLPGKKGTIVGFDHLLHV